MAIRYTTEVDYDDNHDSFTIVDVEWPEIEAFLGRFYKGTPDDDHRIVMALIEAGAPAWVIEALVDNTGDTWALYEPIQN